MTISRSRTIMMATLLAGAGVLAAGSQLMAKDGGSSNSSEVRIRCSASLRRGADMDAEWRSVDNATRTSFKVQVEDLASTSGLTVQVGAFTSPVPEVIAPTAGLANGVAELDLDSQDGDLVPALKSGDQVNVLQNGTGLLSCFLR